MISEQEVWSERTRTLSSDSGCDVLLEPLGLYSYNLEIIVKRWQARLVKVVQQETNRAEKVTQWATEALKNCDEDECRQQRILDKWRGQMKGVVEFTEDLVESINKDAKDAINDTAKKLCSREGFLNEQDYSFQIRDLDLKNKYSSQGSFDDCADFGSLEYIHKEHTPLRNENNGNITENEGVSRESKCDSNTVKNIQRCPDLQIKDMVNYWNEKVLHEELTNNLLDEEPADAEKNSSQSSLW